MAASEEASWSGRAKPPVRSRWKNTERLRHDLADATQQFAATSDVLSALGRHVSDPDAVLDTIVENARRLCRAGAALISMRDGHVYRISRAVGLSDEYMAHLTEHPIVHDRSTLQGRAGLDRRTEQITDVLADPNYGRQGHPADRRVPDADGIPR